MLSFSLLSPPYYLRSEVPSSRRQNQPVTSPDVEKDVQPFGISNRFLDSPSRFPPSERAPRARGADGTYLTWTSHTKRAIFPPSVFLFSGNRAPSPPSRFPTPHPDDVARSRLLLRVRLVSLPSSRWISPLTTSSSKQLPVPPPEVLDVA